MAPEGGPGADWVLTLTRASTLQDGLHEQDTSHPDSRAPESRTATSRYCAASTSTWRRAASSPCSARNGAGKTTVIKILSTLLKADGGTARVNGFDVVTQAADVRESISLTGQFAAVDEILTGRENLVLIATLRHLDDSGPIADDLLRSLLAHRGRAAPGRDRTPAACAAASTSR